MKNLVRILKPFDYIIIVGAVIISFVPWIIASVTSPALTQHYPIAIVKIKGEEVDRYILDPNTPHTIKTYYPNDNQYNIIEQDGARIRVKEDNSPDQIAVMTSWIEKPGQLSICLPHQLIIEIIGTTEEEMLVLPL